MPLNHANQLEAVTDNDDNWCYGSRPVPCFITHVYLYDGLLVGKSMGTPYLHGSWVWVLMGMGTGIALSTHDLWQPMLQPMATRVIILITT